MKPIILLIALLLLIPGCGGGGSSSLDVSGSGTLTRFDSENEDGSVSDKYSFVAKHDGYIEVSMSSEAFDPYVVVYEGYDEEVRVGEDDDSGPGDDAEFRFYATRGSSFTAKFTSSEAGLHTGDYHFGVREVDAPRSVVSDEPATATAKVRVDPATKNTKK